MNRIAVGALSVLLLVGGVYYLFSHQGRGDLAPRIRVTAPAVPSSAAADSRGEPVPGKNAGLPVHWPKAQHKILKPDSYKLRPSTNSDIVLMELDGQPVAFLTSQMVPRRCEPKDKLFECVLLPNGQMVRASAELQGRIPRLRVLDAYTRWRENRPSNQSGGGPVRNFVPALTPTAIQPKGP